jgi:uncharacterized protein DUF4199
MRMTRILALYGIVAGLIVGIPVDWLVLSRTPQWVSGNMMLVTYLAMIVGLTAVFLGIKHYRDQALGGVIRFVPALLVGLGISAVASLIYALCWETSLALNGLDFAGLYAKQMIEAARAKGASPAELQKVIADAEAFAKSYSNPLYRIPVTFMEMFPVGVLISLVSAGLLRNPRLLPARAPT